MSNKAVRYTPEFKRQMVDLVRSVRTPASLAKEFGPTPWSISLWVGARQATCRFISCSRALFLLVHSGVND